MVARNTKVLVGAALGLSLAGASAYLQLRRPPASIAAPPIASAAPVDPWCASGLEPLPGGGCFAAPRDARAAPLVIYLHGRYEASAPRDELDRQKRVALQATERGFALLAFRGEVGACQRPELTDWVCWPSNERTAAAGPAFVARWQTSIAEATRRTPRTRTFVLGFSNGAYFAGLIALRELFDAAAFVVAAGGPTEPVEKRERMPPILLLTGDEDPSIDDTMRFDRLLSKIEWPHDIYSRAGGHLLTDADIGLALTFFERVVREPMPLTPPLSTHRPTPIPRDASAEGSISVDASEIEAAAAEVTTPASQGAAPSHDDDEDGGA